MISECAGGPRKIESRVRLGIGGVKGSSMSRDESHSLKANILINFLEPRLLPGKIREQGGEWR